MRQTLILASALMIPFVLIFGALSDWIGKHRLHCMGAAAIGTLAFPSFWLMDHAGAEHPRLVWLAIILPLTFAYPAVYGPQAALFSSLFPPRVRYTGISFCYQFSGVFASGLTPLIATFLLGYGGGKPWYICGYVVLTAIVSLASVLATPRAQQDAPGVMYHPPP